MENQNNLTPVFGDGISTVLSKFKGKGMEWGALIVALLAIVATVIAAYNILRLLTKEGRQEMGKVLKELVISVIAAGILWLGFNYVRNLASNEASSDFGDLESGSN